MARRKFMQLASVFVLAVSLVAFPGLARADGDLFGDGSDPQIPTANCSSGGFGASACSIGLPFMTCSVTCGPAYYACCQYQMLVPVCACVYAP